MPKDWSEMPFYGVTNPELYNVLENTEIEIKRLLNNNDIYNLIKATQHDSNIIENNSKNYTSEELRNELHCKKSTQTRRNVFRLIHLNIRSLDKNWAQLIGLLKTIDADFDVIALSETGRKNIENREAQLKHYGYNMLVHKPTQIRGGAALIYKSDLDITEREDLKISPECKEMYIENIWMEIKLGSEPSDKIIVGCIYKHPGGSINNVKNFRHKIEHNLILINKENKQCLITGDLNIDGLKIKSNNEVENFFNMLLEHNFTHNNMPHENCEQHRTTYISHRSHNNKQPNSKTLHKDPFRKHLQWHKQPPTKFHSCRKRQFEKNQAQKANDTHTRRQKQR